MMKLKKRGVGRTVLCAASVALLSVAAATHAAADDAKIKSASFSIQPVYQGDEIVVTSRDGTKWDTIDAKALKLSATMLVDTKHPGYVSQAGILLGSCDNTSCANNPVMFYMNTSTRDLHSNKVFTFPGNKIPVSTTGIATVSYGDEILNACNNHLQSGGATKSYSFKKMMTASFSVNTRKAVGSLPPAEVSHGGANDYPDYNGGDVTRQAQFAVKVTCKPYVAPPPVLTNTTFMAYTHGSTGCPRKATVEAQFYTDREGKIEFILYRDDGANQKITVNTTKKPSGIYHAYWHKDYTFAKSVDRKYMIVVIGHKYSSPWKPLVVKCGLSNDAAGPGGITGKPNPTHGNPGIPPVIVTPKPPKKPAIKVAPLPQVVCVNGKVAGSQCFCPARTKKVKFGPNRYRCISSVVTPKKRITGNLQTAPSRTRLINRIKAPRR